MIGMPYSLSALSALRADSPAVQTAPRGCYDLCELACGSTIVPFAVDAVVVLCPEPRSLFSCQALAAETKTHLRTQIKQKQSLSLRK